jgi:hypothetical protein
VVTDFGNMDKAKEWIEKIENEAKLTEKPTNEQDFQ